MITIKAIRKRDGKLARYDVLKIKSGIFKAAHAVKFASDRKLENCVSEIDKTIWKRFSKRTPTVENVQDIVEEVLIKLGLNDVAKSFLIFRDARFKVNKMRESYNIKDELRLSVNAIHVLQKRYFLKDDKGNVVENVAQLFRRAARSVAQADRLYGKNPMFSEELFFKMLSSLEFLPNSPTLMNAGTKSGQLSACFVLPVNDSIGGIFDSMKEMAKIQQSGGGTGFSFSRLRSRGSIVHSTKGVASGPVSFIEVFDKTTDVIKQGGKRRGANMAVLRVDHPDILEFINSKNNGGLSNFNISVGVTDAFLKAVKSNKSYELIEPGSGVVAKRIRARDVFRTIISSAWKTGDPGIIFLDEINRKHPLFEPIEATNPCGEQPLLPYESCNLGSLNLVKFVENGKINFDKLKDRIRLAVHFLDNVIDVNNYTTPKIEEITKRNRKIGLGVMGFADMLILLGVPYNSAKAVKLGEELMKFIDTEARQKSKELGAERGSFSGFRFSKLKRKYDTMRNTTVTTIAPTGTISIIAGVSSGIEPLFAVSYTRNVLEDTRLFETNPIFEEMARQGGFYNDKLMMQIAKTGSVQTVKVPREIKELFITAHEIEPEWHVKMQAAFQKHTDNAVSKTVNLKENVSLKEVEKIFWLAYKLKSKGITIFRNNSRDSQVLYLGEDLDRKRPVIADSEFSGGCPLSHCGN